MIDKLIGHSIRPVDYFENDYGTVDPTWSDLGDFDSLDFGLNLTLENESIVAGSPDKVWVATRQEAG